MYNVHYLKTWPEYFKVVENKTKTFEVRKNDRKFEVGDFLVLQEYDPENQVYTGRYEERRITYILDKQPFVPEGYVIMSII